MEIPQKLLDKWKTLRSAGDAIKLAEQTNMVDENFNRALREGKCSDAVFAALAEFYEKKAQLVKEYL